MMEFVKRHDGELIILALVIMIILIAALSGPHCPKIIEVLKTLWTW
jgi:hypothetical protein